MPRTERALLNFVLNLVKPARVYEACVVKISDDEWAASIAFFEGPDRRFRFTRGQLYDEADIGDARVA